MRGFDMKPRPSIQSQQTAEEMAARVAKMRENISIVKKKKVKPPVYRRTENEKRRRSVKIVFHKKRKIPERSLTKSQRKALLAKLGHVAGSGVTCPPRSLNTETAITNWYKNSIGSEKANQKRGTLPRKSTGTHFSPEYREYLRSPTWKRKRLEAFAVHGRKCRRCGSFMNLHCHHLTYERLGNENVKTDLEILCLSCHESEHGRKFD